MVTVTVKPRSRQDRVAVAADGTLVVHVRAVPADGAANDAVRRLLAAHLRVAPSCLVLVRGATARTKTWENVCA